MELQVHYGATCFGVWDDTDGCDWRFEGHPGIKNPAESANPGMLAVAAMGYKQPDGEGPRRFIEGFSSLGPTRDGRVKPDVTGIDRLSGHGSYDAPLGTSFSSPSVAGLAALVIGRYGDDSAYDTPAEIAAYLKENTEDIAEAESADFPGATVGPDNTTGYGLVVLPDPDATKPPVVTLHLSTDEIFEGDLDDNSTHVSAHLDKPAAGDLTVTLSTETSTAYALDGTTLTIAAGKLYSSGSVSLTASDNATADGHLDGSVSGTVSGGGTATIANPESVEFIVIDDESPPRAKLVPKEAVIPETLFGAITAVSISLDHPVSPAADTVFSLSAPASSYYKLTGNSVTVAAGKTEGSHDLVGVAPQHNTVYSGEALPVTVSATASPSTGVVGPDPVIMHIIDDEPMPTVRLLVNGHSIFDEDDGHINLLESLSAPVPITAELTGPVSEDLTVVVSAPASSHYNLSANKTLTIAAGATESTGTVTIVPVNNEIDDADRFFALSGTASGGNGVADPQSYRVNISDDEGHPEVRLWVETDRISEKQTTVVEDNFEWLLGSLGRNAVGDVEITITATPVSPATSSDFVLSDPATLTINDGTNYSSYFVEISGSGSGVYRPGGKAGCPVGRGDFRGRRGPGRFHYPDHHRRRLPPGGPAGLGR